MLRSILRPIRRDMAHNVVTSLNTILNELMWGPALGDNLLWGDDPDDVILWT